MGVSGIGVTQGIGRSFGAVGALLVSVVLIPGLPGGFDPGAGASSAQEALQWLQRGDRVHVTGCPNGRLTTLRIDIFEEPPGTISPWVARLKGTSRKQICDGEVVIVREVRRVRGDLAVLVEPIRQEVRGWVSSEFVGAHFPLYRCHTHFQDAALVEKCLHGELPP